jgi:hypothetical protein
MATKKKVRSIADKMQKMISKHRRSAALIITGIVIGFLVATGGVAMLAAGLVIREPGLIIPGAAILLVGLGMAAGFSRRLYTTPSEVRLYPLGIRWTARRQEFEYDWDEVDEVYRYELITISQHGRSRNAYVRLRFEDGTELKCTNSLLKYDELAQRIMSETASALLSKARKRLDEGVSFGPIELDRKGVTIEDDFYSYEDLRQTRVRNGHILLYFPKKRQYEYPLAEIPNYLVLFGLLDELGKPGIIDQRPDPD